MCIYIFLTNDGNKYVHDPDVCVGGELRCLFLWPSGSINYFTWNLLYVVLSLSHTPSLSHTLSCRSASKSGCFYSLDGGSDSLQESSRECLVD